MIIHIIIILWHIDIVCIWIKTLRNTLYQDENLINGSLALRVLNGSLHDLNTYDTTEKIISNL